MAIVASRNAGGGGSVVVVGRKERGGDSGVGVECVSVFVCMCSELVGAVEYAVVSRQACKQARAQSTQASESAPGNGSRESFGWVS